MDGVSRRDLPRDRDGVDGVSLPRDRDGVDGVSREVLQTRSSDSGTCVPSEEDQGDVSAGEVVYARTSVGGVCEAVSGGGSRSVTIGNVFWVLRGVTTTRREDDEEFLGELTLSGLVLQGILMQGGEHEGASYFRDDVQTRMMRLFTTDRNWSLADRQQSMCYRTGIYEFIRRRGRGCPRNFRIWVNMRRIVDCLAMETTTWAMPAGDRTSPEGRRKDPWRDAGRSDRRSHQKF